MITDSGTRREFNSGAVRDIEEGKGRCDLLPLEEVAIFMGRSVLVNISRYCNTGRTLYLESALKEFIDEGFDSVETAMLELSKHFEDGAKKYGEYNWQKGIPTHSYIDSAVRHYLRFRRGDGDERHDRAFMWNIICCIWTVHHMPELNDYRKETENDG